MIGFVAALAAEEAPVCELSSLPELGDRLSVAWVSPLGRRARARAWLTLVPTRELRAFAGTVEGDLPRSLQWLGLRRSSKVPKRRYKVVIFDVAREHVCWPILTDESPSGVVSCDLDQAGPHGVHEGCGWLTDLATGEQGALELRGQWATLSSDGFCLLPLERFLNPDG